MKIQLMIALGVVFLACQVGAEESLVLKTQNDRENYTAGISIMRSLKQEGGVINLDIVIQGMKDELTGDRHLLNEDTVRETMLALQSALMQKQTCGVIEYQDHFKAICTGALSKIREAYTQHPARARVPVRDEEQTLAALRIASLAPPKGISTPLPAASQALVKIQMPVPVQQETFAALLTAQEQAAASEEPKIELGDLTRRYGEAWLKKQPH